MPRGSEGRPSNKEKESHETFRRINISLPIEICIQLDAYCEQTERARSWVIKKAVEEYLKNNDK